MAAVRRPVIADDSVDVTISYSRERPPVPGATEILKDFAILMAAPSVAYDKIGRPRDIRAVPLISSTTTPEDWDWASWAAENNVEFAQLHVAFRFDTDAACVAACKAGLGVAMIPVENARIEGEAGLLVPFGRFPERYSGSYWLATARRLRRPAQLFVNWLLKVAPSLQPNHKYDGRLVVTTNGVRLQDRREREPRKARR